MYSYHFYSLLFFILLLLLFAIEEIDEENTIKNESIIENIITKNENTNLIQNVNELQTNENIDNIFEVNI